ncbi:MAG: hypothetical protein KDJ16_02090 [Hyphomicrobiales bacterium]|nr:hypothetical protein [Hyphomicrobiales bacterium]
MPAPEAQLADKILKDRLQLLEDHAALKRIVDTFSNLADEIACGTTAKGETFRNSGAYVSRKSVADLVVKLADRPALGSVRLGVRKA